MDKFWLYSLSLIFNCYIWTNTVTSEGPCNHKCITDVKCKSKLVQNRCYYVFIDQLRSWTDSRIHCLGQNLSMATIDNKDVLRKNNFNFSALMNNTPDYLRIGNSRSNVWLGGRAFNFPSWSFTNGAPVHGSQLDLWPRFIKVTDLTDAWTAWSATQRCGFFAYYPYGFNIHTAVCYQKKHFLCRKHDCDIASGGECLVLVREGKPWFEARSHCIDLGGDLYYLKEDEKVTTAGLDRNSSIYLNMSYVPGNVHIGMIHKEWKWVSPESNDEEWSDGTRIVYTNWTPEPPNRNDCLMMYGDTEEWEDEYCPSRLLTLCQESPEMVAPKQPTPNFMAPTEQTSTKQIQGGLTTLNPPTAGTPDQSTTTLASPTATDSKDVGSASENRNTIILGSCLGFAFVLILGVIVIVYYRLKRVMKQTPQMENTIHTASSPATLEDRSSTTGVYNYIVDDGLYEEPLPAGDVYHYASGQEIPFHYLRPPRDGTPQNEAAHPAPANYNNYLHLAEN